MSLNYKEKKRDQRTTRWIETTTANNKIDKQQTRRKEGTKREQQKQRYKTKTIKQVSQQCSTYKSIEKILRNVNEAVKEDDEEQEQIKKISKENNPIQRQTKITFPVIYKAQGKEHTENRVKNDRTDILAEKEIKRYNIKWNTAEGQCEGDNLWIGEKPGIKKAKRVRFWLQNPNGIKIQKGFSRFRGDLEELKKYDIDFLALPESKLNGYNTFVQDNIPHLVEKHYPGGYVNISNTPGFGNARGKQNGGVTCIAVQALANKYAGQGQDKGGRFNWMNFRGANGYLKVYTLYRVNNDDERRAGMTSAWTEQHIWIQNKKYNQNYNQKIDPRKEVTDTIAEHIKKDIEKNNHVILMGDINESIYGKFNEKMESIGMANVINKFISKHEKIRTHDRGKNIIDGVWATYMPYHYIEKVGMAPFYTGLISDHRGICFDLNCEKMMDNVKIDIIPAPYRRLQSQIPRRAQAYSNILKYMWQHHQMERKIDAVVQEEKNFDKLELEDRLNKIDKEVSQILRCAEKGCCSVGRQASHAWSPKLAEAIKKERVLTQQLKRERKCKRREITREKMERVIEKQTQLKTYRRTLKETFKECDNVRKEHIKALANERVRLNPGREIDREVKMLLHIEEQRRTASAIRRVYEPNARKGINYVLIPARETYGDKQFDEHFNHRDMDVIWDKVTKGNWKDITSWERIERKETIENMLLECMKRHFHQAHGTPLTTDTWKIRLQDNKFIQKIRDGDLSELEGEPEPIRCYFKTLSEDSKKEVEEPIQYTLEKWSNYIKNVKEKTTTSPSGRHFGHLKTMREYLPSIFEQVYTIMNVAVRNNIILERWKCTVTILIEKHKNRPYVHRTRPLHIVEPEVNAIAKEVWARNLMREAEKENKVSDDQYGGRKNRQAQSAVLNKIMYYNINAQTLTETQYDDDDLRSNYDREMVHLVLAEANIKHGIHKDNTEFVKEFIAQQRFHIKTGHGVSKMWYEDSEECHIYGMGQGLAWAGPGWIMASNTICKAKEKMCKGMTFVDPITGKTVSKTQDMFVDDLAGGTNYKDEKISVMQQGKKNLQTHVDLVNVTGGDIALDKCWFYHVNWTFEGGEAVAIAMDGSHSVLSINDPATGRRVDIDQLDVDKEHKTLGCFVNPIGVNTEAYKQIMDFAKEWRSRTKSSNLRPDRILHAYNTGLLQKIKYRLPMYSLSMEQCENVMKIIRPTLLHCMKLQATFPKIIMEADDEYMGLNVTHIYDIMGMEKLKFLIMHVRRNDITGRLLMISMKYTQLEVGSKRLFFNLNYSKWGYLATWTWLTHLWQYMDVGGMEMTLNEQVTQEHQRHNDKFIMDVIVQCCECTEIEVSMINIVRQYYKVLLLSDITKMDGKTIQDNYRKSEGTPAVTRLFFRKQKPTKRMFRVWEKKAVPILTKWVQKHKLQQWIQEPHYKWDWMQTQDQRYIKHRGQIFERMPTHKPCLYVYTTRHIADKAFSEKIDARKTKGGIQVSHAHLKNQNILCDRYMNEARKLTSCRKIYGQMWGYVKMNENMSKEEIVRKMIQGQLVMATDGGMKNNMEAHAWCLAEKWTGEIVVRGHGPVHNTILDANSMRPEMFGIMAAISYAACLCQESELSENVQIPTIALYTDSETSILNTKQNHYPTTKNSFENNIDAKLQMQDLLKQAPFSVKFVHVRAHQDKHTSWDKMDVATKLNVEMDAHVCEYLNMKTKHIAHQEKAVHLPAQKISIALPYDRPSTNTYRRLVNFKLGHRIEDKIKKRFHIKQNHMEWIDWTAIKRVYRGYGKYKRCKVTKAVYQQWHTMRIAKRNGLATSAKCPICREKEETWMHVLQCKDPNRSVECKERLQQIKKLLEQMKTHPILQNRLMVVLIQLTSDYPITLPKSTHQNKYVDRVFREQEKIGFDNMMRGFLTQRFAAVQDKYYRDNKLDGRYHNGQRWTQRLITALHDFLTTMWNFRCEQVQQKEAGTLDVRMRERAHQLLYKLKNKPWAIQYEDRHLIQRQDFVQSTNQDILNWTRRIENSMLTNLHRKQLKQNDIRKYMQSTI